MCSCLTEKVLVSFKLKVGCTVIMFCFEFLFVVLYSVHILFKLLVAHNFFHKCTEFYPNVWLK